MKLLAAFFVPLVSGTLIRTHVPSRMTFRPDGSLKIVHISDTHYEIPEKACRDLNPSPYPCGHANTTDFIRRIIADEKPDLVVIYNLLLRRHSHFSSRLPLSPWAVLTR